jgi:hypothetical protein
MKNFFLFTTLVLFFNTPSFSQIYNLKCNHIYEPSFEKTVIIDLNKDKIIVSGNDVSQYSIILKENNRIDGDYITEITGLIHEKNPNDVSEKDYHVINLTTEFVNIERLTTPSIYMTEFTLIGMGLIIDKKNNDYTFMPDDKTYSDIQDKSNSYIPSPNLYSEVYTFKCNEI